MTPTHAISADEARRLLRRDHVGVMSAHEAVRQQAFKLATALDQIQALVRAEMLSNEGPPIAPVIYDIQDVLDALEVKT